MKNKNLKKNIQEAISEELSQIRITQKELKEGPFDGIVNAASYLRGQMNLGSINKNLSKTADKIDDVWDDTEDLAAAIARKMEKAKNPQVQTYGKNVISNLTSAGNELRNVAQKIRVMGKTGANVPGEDNKAGDEADFEDKVYTDKFGNTRKETAVERWVKSYGGEMPPGRIERSHLNKLFMELRSAGINPFAVPKDKQPLLLQYNNYRQNQIASMGKDPYPNYEHFEKVLGKDAADKMRAKDPQSQQAANSTMGSEEQVSSPNEQKLTQPSPNEPKISKHLSMVLSSLKQKGKKINIPDDKLDIWLGRQMPKLITNPMFDYDNLEKKDKRYLQFLMLNAQGEPDPEKENVPPIASQPAPQIQQQAQPQPQIQQPQQNSNLPPPLPKNMPAPAKAKAAQLSGMKPRLAKPQGHFPPPPEGEAEPMPLVNKKAVKPLPIRSVGTPPQSPSMPKKQIGSPIELPSIKDFFGGVKPASDEELKSLPVPPTEKEQDLRDLMKNPAKWNKFKEKYPKSPKEMSLASTVPNQPPVEETDDEVQVGSVEQPAFKPPPEQPKKKVSAKRKKA